MNISRRRLIKSAAVTASIATLAPTMVFGQSKRKDDTLRVAAIGFGGRGKADLKEMKSHKAFRLTAACDVDKSLHKIVDEFGDNVNKFQDYRQLFNNAHKSAVFLYSSNSIDKLVYITMDGCQ